MFASPLFPTADHSPCTPSASAPAECSAAPAVLKHFRANQGLLLAGAVAYYTLLSLVPLPRLGGDAVSLHSLPGLRLLVVTLVSGVIQRMGTRAIVLFGAPHSLDRLSSMLLNLLGVPANCS
jgi:hypothetical protein